MVGPVTDEVFSFLGPATRALSTHGHAQQVVLIDAPEHQHNVRQFDEYATVVRVAKIGNPLRQWQRVLQASRSQFLKGGLDAVHVHGLLPLLSILMGLRSAAVQAPVVYSPHGSRTLGSLRVAGKIAMLAAQSVARPVRPSAIVSVSREMEALDDWAATDVIESPVADVFFSVDRREAEKPLIVAGGRESSARSVDVFSQLAVLMSGEELGLNFKWLGTVPASAQQRLRAADVTVLPVPDDDACVAGIVAAWMYVAPSFARGFPLFLVQAMAAGLPCVVLDCEQHREVVEDGRTGFLCASEQEMVRKIAVLVDSAPLRREMGAAARASIEARFSESNFNDKLLTAYSTRW